MSKERDKQSVLWAIAAIIFGFSWAVTAWSLSQSHSTNAALLTTIRNLEAETANRAATSELQSRVIAAYTAELMRLGYTEDRLHAIQVDQGATQRRK